MKGKENAHFKVNLNTSYSFIIKEWDSSRETWEERWQVSQNKK
jgi:hypothetical protein